MRIEQIPEQFMNFVVGNKLIDLMNLSLMYNISVDDIYNLLKENDIPVIENSIEEQSFYIEIKNLPEDFNDIIDDFKDQSRSEGEDQMYKFIESLGVKVIPNDRKAIFPKELDMYMPDNKVGIEYDGLYWHKETSLVEKTDICDDKGIRLIRFYEDEWNKKRRICKGLISSALNIYEQEIKLKDCKITEISELQYKQFLKNNHIHGNAESLYRYGLVYDDELVYAIGIKEYDDYYILNRICPKIGVHVQKALEKLLKHFHKENEDITELYTYADRRTQNLQFYEHAGFELIKTMPCEYFYIVRGQRIGKFDGDDAVKLLKKKYKPSKTEEQNLHDNGYDKIYDCGSYKMKITF